MRMDLTGIRVSDVARRADCEGIANSMHFWALAGERMDGVRYLVVCSQFALSNVQTMALYPK